MKVIADRDIPFLRGVIEPYAEVKYLGGGSICAADLRDAGALIIRTRTRCDESLLHDSTVRFIASATIGFDHIDTAYCDAHGITWTTAPGCNSSSVRQYVAAALLVLAERRAMDLSGMTIGVVGVGNVGSKVAALCGALGMRVLLNDPPRERHEGSSAFTPLSELVRTADIVTLHVPLNTDGVDKTLHMVSHDLLTACKPGQILINTSRGEVVESGALKQALRRGDLAACVLDVWESEPAIDRELLALTAIATPHIAGYSADGKANGTAMSVQALSRFFRLPLDNWFPANIPVPADPMLPLDGSAPTAQQVITAAVRATYDIEADDCQLRANPDAFERQRSEYPIRREFHNYFFRQSQVPSGIGGQLAAVGFSPAA